MPVADWNAPKPNQVTHTAIRPGPQMDAFLPERASATACLMVALIVASSVTPSRSRRRRVSSAAVSTFSASALAASRSRYSLREMPSARASAVCDGGSVVSSVRNISAPITTHMPVNENASKPEITASVEASGLPITHMHSSSTPHSDSARFVRSRSPLRILVQRARLIAPHGGMAARNGVRQYSTHSGARLVIAVTSAMAATIQTMIVGIETCLWPNLSVSLPSSGVATANAIA